MPIFKIKVWWVAMKLPFPPHYPYRFQGLPLKDDFLFIYLFLFFYFFISIQRLKDYILDICIIIFMNIFVFRTNSPRRSFSDGPYWSDPQTRLACHKNPIGCSRNASPLDFHQSSIILIGGTFPTQRWGFANNLFDFTFTQVQKIVASHPSFPSFFIQVIF